MSAAHRTIRSMSFQKIWNGANPCGFTVFLVDDGKRAPAVDLPGVEIT